MSGGIEEGADLDRIGRAEIEGGSGGAKASAPAKGPAAGPHAEPSLTDADATPGAGSLPSPSPDDEAAAATG